MKTLQILSSCSYEINHGGLCFSNSLCPINPHYLVVFPDGDVVSILKDQEKIWLQEDIFLFS